MAVTLGIIGVGVMGQRMLQAALAAPDLVTVTGVWDPSEQAMAKVAATAPATPRLGSADAVIAAAACLHVASPPATHLEHARAVLGEGKALLLEKPLAVDMGEARGFVAAAANARAAVDFPFATAPAVTILRGWLEAIGKVQEATISLAFAAWPRPWQKDATAWLDGAVQGGFTREVGSHLVFLARRLLGPLTPGKGQAEWPEAGRSERVAAGAFTAGEVQVTLAGRVAGSGPDDANSLTLRGERGSIRMRDWRIPERREGDGPWVEAEALSEPDRILSLRRQLEQLERLVKGEPHRLATLAEAYEVQTVIEAMLVRPK